MTFCVTFTVTSRVRQQYIMIEQINLGGRDLQVCSFFVYFWRNFQTSAGFVQCYQFLPPSLFLPLSFKATESIQLTLCFLAQHGLSFASKKTVLPKIQKFKNQLWTNPLKMQFTYTVEMKSAVSDLSEVSWVENTCKIFYWSKRQYSDSRFKPCDKGGTWS